MYDATVWRRSLSAILFAFAALLSLHTQVALARAEQAPADATDSQGDSLPPGAVARIGTTRLRHGDTISSLAYSPDGKRLTSTDGHSVGVWDPQTGRCLAFRMLAPQYTLWSPVVSPDGTLIACRLDNGALGVQETESGKLRCNLGCKDSQIYSPAFSHDNRWLVTSDKEGKVVLWDVQAGKVSQQWKSPVNAAFWFRHAFTPDSKTLAHSTSEEYLLFWDVQTGKELLNIEAKEDDNKTGYGLAISPDGKMLATLGYGRVGLWDVKIGRFLREIAPQDGCPGNVFSVDYDECLTCGRDGSQGGGHVREATNLEEIPSTDLSEGTNTSRTVVTPPEDGQPPGGEEK